MVPSLFISTSEVMIAEARSSKLNQVGVLISAPIRNDEDSYGRIITPNLKSTPVPLVSNQFSKEYVDASPG